MSGSNRSLVGSQPHELTYTRTIPKIFGEANLFDAKHILSLPNDKLLPFFQKRCGGDVTTASDGTLAITMYGIKGIDPSLRAQNDEFTVGHQRRLPMFHGFGKIVTIPLIRPGDEIYGHWLLDILPKLTNFEATYPGVPYQVLIRDSAPGWVSALIQNIFPGCQSIKKISPTKSIKTSLFVMSPSRQHDYVAPVITMDTQPPADVSPQKRLYLTRKNLPAQYRGLHNREAVEAVFTSRGFELVSPEQLSIPEQIQLFGEAAIIAGEAGSALHNNVFCSPKTQVINLQSGRQNHFIQAGLCANYGQDSIYVFGKTDTEEWMSDYTIDPDLCIEAIDAAFAAASK